MWKEFITYLHDKLNKENSVILKSEYQTYLDLEIHEVLREEYDTYIP